MRLMRNIQLKMTFLNANEYILELNWHLCSDYYAIGVQLFI